MNNFPIDPSYGFNMPALKYQQPITNTEFHFIQGENAAKAYPIMPGNTAFLFDSEEIPAPKDIPTVTETIFVTKEDFDAAISELKSLLEKPKYEKRGGRNNAQSDIRRDER